MFCACLRDHLKLKLELVKYGGLSNSRRFRQLLTSLMVGRVTFVPCVSPLRSVPSLVPLHRVTRRLYSSRLEEEDDEERQYGILEQERITVSHSTEK